MLVHFQVAGALRGRLDPQLHARPRTAHSSRGPGDLETPRRATHAVVRWVVSDETDNMWRRAPKFRSFEATVRLDGEPVYEGRIDERLRPVHGYYLNGAAHIALRAGTVVTFATADGAPVRAFVIGARVLSPYPASDEPFPEDAPPPIS